jgi:methyl-accepting chemotaxis protein
MITSVAEQTTLLLLNADIDAAREAGDGSRFAITDNQVLELPRNASGLRGAETGMESS